MKTFVIADPHFGHRNVIEYCNRPFESVEDMDEAMIRAWNSVVGKNDRVIVLGDFALCGKARVIEIGQKLKGRKILLKGNHDGASADTYHGAGFEEVYSFPIVVNDFLICSHYPQFTLPNGLYANIYGHVHNDEKYATVTPRSACVSAERWNYKPVLIDDLMILMKEAGENEREREKSNI